MLGAVSYITKSRKVDQMCVKSNMTTIVQSRTYTFVHYKAKQSKAKPVELVVMLKNLEYPGTHPIHSYIRRFLYREIVGM